MQVKGFARTPTPLATVSPRKKPAPPAATDVLNSRALPALSPPNSIDPRTEALGPTSSAPALMDDNSIFKREPLSEVSSSAPRAETLFNTSPRNQEATEPWKCGHVWTSSKHLGCGPSVRR